MMCRKSVMALHVMWYDKFHKDDPLKAYGVKFGDLC